MKFKKTLDIVIDTECIYYDGATIPINIGMVAHYKDNLVLSLDIGIREGIELNASREAKFKRSWINKTKFDRIYENLSDFHMALGSWMEHLGKEFYFRLWSYNATFDKRALPIDQHHMEWNCLMVLGLSLIMRDYGDDYKLFCHRTGRITSNGNVRSRCMDVCSFIAENQSPVFTKHTGLSDAKQGYTLLKWLKSHKGWTTLERAPRANAWRIINPPSK